jgi:hypothetical protein
MPSYIGRILLVMSACLYMGLCAVWSAPLSNDTLIIGGHQMWVLQRDRLRPGLNVRVPHSGGFIHFPNWLWETCALAPAAVVLLGRRAGFVKESPAGVLPDFRPQWMRSPYVATVLARFSFTTSILSVGIVLPGPLRYADSLLFDIANCAGLMGLFAIPVAAISGSLVSKRFYEQRDFVDWAYRILVASLSSFAVEAWLLR